MLLTNAPSKISLPFANAGAKNTIPVPSQVGITAGAASFTDGFPPLTRTPLASGGVPPSGLDMNGVLFDLSDALRWACAGGGYPYDSAFANNVNIGGYPKGARVMRSDGTGYWLNTVDNNVHDPETTGAAAAGWVPDATNGMVSIPMASSNVTLTAAQYGKPVINITGALTANLNLIFPSIVGEWIIINSTTGIYDVTAKTAGGTGVVFAPITQATATKIYSDATNIHSLVTASSALLPLSPIGAPNVVDDSLSAPPASPVAGEAYLVGPTATGAWAGLSGHLLQYPAVGTTWIDIYGRAVVVGDRLGLTLEHGTVAGGFTGHNDEIAQVVVATPGSYAYSFTVPVAGNLVLTNGINSPDYGHGYAYNATGGTWVEVSLPGTGLSQTQADGRYPLFAGAAGGTANALTATIATGLTALYDGLNITLDAATANTGASTLNLTLGTTATGAIAIKANDGGALYAGAIAGAGHMLDLSYSATTGVWMLRNQANTGLQAGSIVRSGMTAPTNSLYCNGSQVAQATYPALFAAVGNDFNYIGANFVNANPWRQQWRTNSLQTADITGWAAGTSLPGSLSISQAIVTNSRVYLLGGVTTGGIFVATVYTAPINVDGTLGTWATGTSLPGVLAASQAIVTNNRVYLLGGQTALGTWVSTVYTAPINVDGTLGAWATGTALPAPLSNFSAFIVNGKAYIAGGQTTGGTYVSTIYMASINSDGTLDAWIPVTSLRAPTASASVAITNGRVFLLGGITTGGTFVPTVYSAMTQSDGTLGAWAINDPLPGALANSQCVVTDGRIYLLGGITTGGTYASTVYTAPVNNNGTIGSWVTGTAITGALGTSQVIVTGSKIYLLGGQTTAGAYVSTVYVANFSGGKNSYNGDSYLSATPDAGNFYLPDLRYEQSFYPQAVRSYIKY